VTEKRL